MVINNKSMSNKARKCWVISNQDCIASVPPITKKTKSWVKIVKQKADQIPKSTSKNPPGKLKQSQKMKGRKT